MSVKGRPYRPVTEAQRKVLNVLTADERAVLLRRIRQREWVAKRRRENPEKYLQAVRESRKRAVLRGEYRKGGRRYYGTRSSPKRLAYFRRYNLNVRKVREYFNRGIT